MKTRCAPYQTRPKAPMPTGCKSVYLEALSIAYSVCPQAVDPLPARNLERGAEDLGTHEFRHVDRLLWLHC